MASVITENQARVGELVYNHLRACGQHPVLNDNDLERFSGINLDVVIKKLEKRFPWDYGFNIESISPEGKIIYQSTVNGRSQINLAGLGYHQIENEFGSKVWVLNPNYAL